MIPEAVFFLLILKSLGFVDTDSGFVDDIV
jgi:hypothetical protein